MHSHSKNIVRCHWCGNDPLYQEYHDTHWGRPCTDEKTLFEFITLEGAQAGLSWITILRKRAGYQKAFADYDLEKIAEFGEEKIQTLKNDVSIVRNILKIRSVVSNAQAAIDVCEEQDSLKNYFWQFVDGKAIQNKWKNPSDIPASTDLSDRIAKDMKKRGFKFFGSTICYAYLQSMGLVNDHLIDCFAHQECANQALGEVDIDGAMN